MKPALRPPVQPEASPAEAAGDAAEAAAHNAPLAHGLVLPAATATGCRWPPLCSAVLCLAVNLGYSCTHMTRCGGRLWPGGEGWIRAQGRAAGGQIRSGDG